MSTPASTQVRRPAPRRRRLDASLIVGIALIAVIVERTSTGEPPRSAASDQRAFIRIHSVTLDFNPRPRDDSVVV